MKIEITIPDGVNVNVDKNHVIVSGKEGTIDKEIKSRLLDIKLENNKVLLVSKNDKRKSFAQTKTIQSVIANMISGVQKKYKYQLKIIYSHFPTTVALKNNVLQINNFVGGKKQISIPVFENVSVSIKGRDIFVESVDKENAGIFAGLIEQKTRVKKRDRRIFQDGIYIVKKGVQDE